jgi:hypothetical protein
MRGVGSRVANQPRDAAVGKSTEIVGSRRVGIGRGRLAKQERVEIDRDYRCRHRSVKVGMRHGRNRGRQTERTTSNHLRAISALRAIFTGIVPGVAHRHLCHAGHHIIHGGHGSRLNNRQTHAQGYKHREQPSEGLPYGRKFHGKPEYRNRRSFEQPRILVVRPSDAEGQLARIKSGRGRSSGEVSVYGHSDIAVDLAPGCGTDHWTDAP